MDPIIGRTIGGVKIDGKLGTGGMASVYSGTDGERGGVRCAIKLLSVTSHDSYRGRFQREAQIGKTLRHPLLVGVDRYGVSGDFDFMVMELVQGENLYNVLRRAHRLKWPLVAAIGRDIARGLRALHVQGVVHRDLKPANVLLDGRGGLKLADFGLARWSQAPSEMPTEIPLTETGDAFGTPIYMAPEQFEDAKTTGTPADLYALGVLCYESIAGHPPFESNIPHKLALQHSREMPRPITAEIPEAFRECIEQMLHKDPTRRPAAQEAVDSLTEIASRATAPPIPLEPPSGSQFLDWDPNRINEASTLPPNPETRPARRRPAVIAALITGILLLGGVLASQSPWVQLQLASPEERSRYEAVLSALGTVKEDPQPLVDAIRSYRRDFGDSGKLRDVVDELRLEPHHMRANVYFLVSDESRMLYVPPDSYIVGRKGDDDRFARQRSVELQGYLIDQREVSNRRYERFLAEWRAGGSNHQCGRDDLDHAPPPASARLSPEPDGPVVGLSAWDALEYARFYDRRLPTEEEWEVAASWDPQSGEQRPYPWGNGEPSEDNPYLANLAFAESGVMDEEGEFRVTCAASGSFEIDRSGFGLVDVAGNAAEWTLGDSPLPGKQAIRGGSMLTKTADEAHLAFRREHDPDEQLPAVGFRTVMPYSARE